MIQYPDEVLLPFSHAPTCKLVRLYLIIKGPIVPVQAGEYRFSIEKYI
jgi:hypothetical protein